jgi:hypothetical protein
MKYQQIGVLWPVPSNTLSPVLSAFHSISFGPTDQFNLVAINRPGFVNSVFDKHFLLLVFDSLIKSHLKQLPKIYNNLLKLKETMQ